MGKLKKLLFAQYNRFPPCIHNIAKYACKKYFIFQEKNYLFFIRSQQLILPEWRCISSKIFSWRLAFTTSFWFLIKQPFLLISYFLAVANQLLLEVFRFFGILFFNKYCLTWLYKRSSIVIFLEETPPTELNFSEQLFCIQWQKWTRSSKINIF